LYGRHQDAALRKARKSANERNELRLWLSPMTLEGKLVWVGQISRVARIRSFSREFKIEPDVDEARTYIIQSLLYTQGLAKYGYVKGVGASSISKPRENLTGSEYFTDGYRAVLWVSSDPISLTELEFVAWEVPQRRQPE
jgi:hypothetical protein